MAKFIVFTCVEDKNISPYLDAVENRQDLYSADKILSALSLEINNGKFSLQNSVPYEKSLCFLSHFASDIYPPVRQVEYAKMLSELFNSLNMSCCIFSNSPDFVQAISVLVPKDKLEFYIGKKCVGNNIEAVFKEFNKALEMIDSLSDSQSK